MLLSRWASQDWPFASRVSVVSARPARRSHSESWRLCLVRFRLDFGRDMWVVEGELRGSGWRRYAEDLDFVIPEL